MSEICERQSYSAAFSWDSQASGAGASAGASSTTGASDAGYSVTGAA